MIKTVSLTWPWNWTGTRWSFERTIEECVAVQPDRIAIRAFDGPFEYGTRIQTKIVWGSRTYRDLERALKAGGIGVDLWGPVFFRFFDQEIGLLDRTLMPYYNPQHVFFDVEGKTARKYAGNIGSFLRGAVRLRRRGAKLWLQSYRRADLHAWVQFEKWLSYKDPATGEFIIDGLAHQLYPEGVQSVSAYVEDVSRALQSHEKLAQAAGRREIPWFPTLPAYTEHGWSPSVDGVRAMMQWLWSTLRERLVGVNFWSLDADMYRLRDMLQFVTDLGGQQEVLGRPTEPPPTIPPPTLEEIVADHEQRLDTVEGFLNLR